MSAILILIIAAVLLVLGYVFYGSWLAKQWGVDPNHETPAHTSYDGKDFVPANPAVLMGHHFSSIAGAGPINGPIQAAVFGWVPVFLWVVIGGIFFGAMHDFGALFASIRHNGGSVGEVIKENIGVRAQRLFTIFALLVLILVIASFTAVVAGTFVSEADSFFTVGMANVSDHAATATTSLLFIVIAFIFGFFVYRKNVKIGPATIVSIIGIVAIVFAGLNIGVNMGRTAWVIFIAVYVMLASLLPVWMLLQPRDYLSSFLLYGMMILALVGIIGCHPSIDAMPAFTGFYDTVAPTGSSIGYLFPALFVTIACGAISGFHSLVGSGTTAKQLNREQDARPIAYGGMLIESALAIIALCAVAYIWKDYASGTTVVPTAVFAGGLSAMLGTLFGPGVQSVTYSLFILAVSAFCLTSLDTATRLARYMFQEFWVKPGEDVKTLTGARKVLVNPYVSTIITVVIGIALGMTGYAKIWALFGAANQLLAALGLLAVAAWLGKIGRNNKMFYIPMAFMLLVTLTSLVFTIKTQIGLITTGADVTWGIVRGVIAVLLIVLAIDLVVQGVKALSAQSKSKAQENPAQ